MTFFGLEQGKDLENQLHTPTKNSHEYPSREFFTLCETPPPPKKMLINLLSAPRPLVAAKASLLHCA